MQDLLAGFPVIIEQPVAWGERDPGNILGSSRSSEGREPLLMQQQSDAQLNSS